MGDAPRPDPELAALRTAGADRSRVLGALFEEHRKRLLKMVHLRMDPRLKQRIGASDVIQDAFVDVDRRIDEYLDDPKMPFFLWLRLLTSQRLVDLHRHHVGAKKRDVRKQVRAAIGPMPRATSVALVNRLMDGGTTPTQALERVEAREAMVAALDAMDAKDRDVLVLRHFEGLSNTETALELGLEKAAASKRHVRALQRLGEILAEVERAG